MNEQPAPLETEHIEESAACERREPEPPYPWCSRVKHCTAKGFCDRNPNCGD